MPASMTPAALATVFCEGCGSRPATRPTDGCPECGTLLSPSSWRLTPETLARRLGRVRAGKGISTQHGTCDGTTLAGASCRRNARASGFCSHHESNEVVA